METGKVESQIENGVARITFFHPQSNSLPGALLSNLASAIRQAGEDPKARVIVLQSEGEKAFCAGASFDELAAIRDEETGKKFFSGFAHVINTIRKAPKFVIARIQGKAVGGGVGIACAADYALALKGSSVKLSELAIGIGPFVVGPAVERKTGKSAFTQLAVNATEWQSDEWALQKGIYNELLPSIPELDKAVSGLAARLTESSTDAMKEIKRICWEGTESWDQLLMQRAAISGKLVLSDFTRIAISKFKSKN